MADRADVTRDAALALAQTLARLAGKVATFADQA